MSWMIKRSEYLRGLVTVRHYDPTALGWDIIGCRLFKYRNNRGEYRLDIDLGYLSVELMIPTNSEIKRLIREAIQRRVSGRKVSKLAHSEGVQVDLGNTASMDEIRRRGEAAAKILKQMTSNGTQGDLIRGK